MATMVLFLLIIGQGWLGWIEMRPLKGAFVVTDIPRPSWELIRSGEWQRVANNYIKANHGFHEVAVRTYNQYVWSCYHLSPNRALAMGENGYLFESYVVNEGYERGFYDFAQDTLDYHERARIFAQRINKVQSILEECGTHLVLLVLPSKDRLCCEQLPRMYTNPKPQVTPLWKLMPPLLDDHDVKYVDFCTWFEKRNSRITYPVFPQMGTHWSYRASMDAFDSVFSLFRRLDTNCCLPQIAISEEKMETAHGNDVDLAEMLNIWRQPRQSNCCYAQVRVQEDGCKTKRKPRWIEVGDSYFWNVIESFPLDSLFEYYHYWYYGSAIYCDPNYGHTDEVDWVQQLLDADFITLSYCSAQLYRLLYAERDFVARALLELCIDPQEINRVCCALSHKLEGSVDDPQKEAKLRLYQNPEQYFPELAGPGIPQIRNPRVKTLLSHKLGQ